MDEELRRTSNRYTSNFTRNSPHNLPNEYVGRTGKSFAPRATKYARINKLTHIQAHNNESDARISAFKIARNKAKAMGIKNLSFVVPCLISRCGYQVLSQKDYLAWSKSSRDTKLFISYCEKEQSKIDKKGQRNNTSVSPKRSRLVESIVCGLVILIIIFLLIAR